MKKIFLLVFMCSYFMSYAQKDTVVNYLNKKKSTLVTKDKAYFTQVIITKKSSWEMLMYNVNGTLISKENFSDYNLTKKTGEQKYFHSNGKLSSLRTYNNQSVLHGKFLTFRKDGSKNMIGMNKNGEREGMWNFYYRNGNKIARLVYSEGKVLDHKLWYENGEPKDEKLILERRPKFKSGKNAFQNYVRRNLTPKFKNSNLKGRLLLKFTINTKGRAEDIVIRPKNILEKYQKIILSFFENMPDWEPGIQLNRKVKVTNTLPIKLN